MRQTQREASMTPAVAGAVTNLALGLGAVWLVVAIVIVAVSGDAENVPWHVGSAIGLGAALVVALRCPDHPLTPWFAIMASSVLASYALQDVLRWGIGRDASAGVLWVVAFALSAVVATSIVAGMRIFTRFPDGIARDRIEARAVHVVELFQVAALSVFVFADEIPWPSFISEDRAENPARLLDVSLDVEGASVVIDLSQAAAIIGFAVLVRRYRRSDRSERRHMRWLLLPVVAAMFGLFAELLLLRDTGHAGALFNLVVSVALALGIAFAIVRPEGLDADLVLRRSVLWGLVWTVIASGYVLFSALLGVTVANRFSAGWAVTMTVMAMLTLQPVRSQFERLASRRLFGPPPDPHRALARLGDSLAGTYDLDAVVPQIEQALIDALGVEWVRVRVTPRVSGAEPDTALSVPITLDGELVGVVQCGPRATGPLTADDEAVVTTLAGQAAMAVRNVRLTTELRERTEQLRSSRARLVRAEELERRRIERDIHDGAQQQIVALIGHTGLVQSRIRRDAGVSDEFGAVVEELDELQAGLGRLLTELRDLAAGIHPSVLRDGGLLSATEALAARHPVPVEIRADIDLRTQRLPVEIEAAGYYSIAESLANSLKHARASRVDIELHRDNGELSISVSDDGVGFQPGSAGGSGLANLAERVAAVDGVLDIDTAPGAGTTVRAKLPAAEAAS